jgi:hypothetical protein
MDSVYRLQGVELESDTNKFQINLEKHGVSFEEAAEVFFDPFYQEGDATVNDEQRNFILGYSRTQRLLLVVYVERSLRIRIISSRPATRTERKLYEHFWRRNKIAIATSYSGNSLAKHSHRYFSIT